MSRYNPQDLEPKWQTRWFEKNYFKTYNPGESGFDPNKKPFYILDMFPYPSGSGLHVGHASGYIGTDIIARRKRMEGYTCSTRPETSFALMPTSSTRPR